MIKAYGMPSCPDCAEVAEKIKVSDRESEFGIINIDERVAYLKAFLQLRGREKAFRPAREGGYVGIPCFAREDGTVSFDSTESGL